MVAMIQPEGAEEPVRRSNLELVVPPVPVEVSTIGRGLVRGALLGWVVVTLAGTMLGVRSGMSFPDAVGFAGFLSIWGGFGFGAMLGGTIALTHDMDSAADH